MRLRHVPHLVGAILVTTLAPADPLLAPHLGGPVFVGPVAAHATSIYWNPAAAGLLQGTHVLVAGTGRLDWTRVDRSPISSSDGEPAAGGDRSFASATATPLTVDHFIGVVSDLSSDQFTLGVALYAPYAERFAATSVTSYQASSGEVFGESLSASVSYRVRPWVTFGFTLGLLFTHVHLQFARDTALDGCTATPCGVEDAARAERYDLDAPLLAFPKVTGTLGILLRFGDWTLGASASNVLAGIALALTGDASVTPAGASAPVTGQAALRFRLPVTLDVGARRRLFGTWDLVLGLRWAQLSDHDRLDLRLYGSKLTSAGIPDWIVRFRGLHDLWWVEVGLEQPPAERLRLGARLRLSTGAVPAEAVAIDQLDAPSAELSGGVELRLSERLALVGAYTLALLLPRDVTASAFSPGARIACNASSYDISTAACAAVREGRAIPTAAGSYRRIGNALTLGLSYDWW